MGEVLRSVARIVENVAMTLYKVYQRTGEDWILRLWSAQDRASLLSTFCAWSQCTTDPHEGKQIVDAIKANRRKYKDKDVDRKEEKKVNRRIRRIEVQAQRACTALLALGPALDPQTIINANEEVKVDDQDEDDDVKSDVGSFYSRK